nr:PREDICTED: protein stum homolog [Struthio camelus australis]
MASEVSLRKATRVVRTFVSAFTVLCGARTDLPDRHMCCVFWLNIAAALIQILTAIVMVGWIMSIFWGMDMVILAISQGKFVSVSPNPPASIQWLDPDGRRQANSHGNPECCSGARSGGFGLAGVTPLSPRRVGVCLHPYRGRPGGPGGERRALPCYECGPRIRQRESLGRGRLPFA